ncbi:MAG: hypothetical protein ACI8SK_001618 [Shewanella sp.]
MLLQNDISIILGGLYEITGKLCLIIKTGLFAPIDKVGILPPINFQAIWIVELALFVELWIMLFFLYYHAKIEGDNE